MENFTGTFAGFTFPQTIAMLARGPLAKRLAEFKQTHGKRVCGPYYRTQPHANPSRAFFYLESDFMPSLRWEWADEVEGSRISHTRDVGRMNWSIANSKSGKNGNSALQTVRMTVSCR